MSAAPAVLLDGARRERRRLGGSSVIVVLCTGVLVVALLLAVLGPPLAPTDPDASDLSNAFLGPSSGHPLGFDSQGRDIFSRLLTGARTSMVGPLMVIVLAVTAGTTLAVVAAWRGGWVASVISTSLDVLFAFPAIMLAILAAAVFGAGLMAPALALAVAYTPYIARVLHGAVLRARASEYIAACEVQGVSGVAICARHLVPNVLPLIVAQATLAFGYAMVDFAAISYVGLGVQPPQADWGVMVASGQQGVLQGYPTESLAAGLCIVVVVVAVNLLGERLAARDTEVR